MLIEKKVVQEKVGLCMEIGVTDDEQAKVCHDKGIGINCHDIEIGVTGGQEKVRDMRTRYYRRRTGKGLP